MGGTGCSADVWEGMDVEMMYWGLDVELVYGRGWMWS